MTHEPRHCQFNVDGDPGQPEGAHPPARDELDSLLREWHQTNASRAAAGRDQLLAALKETTAAGEPEPATWSITVRRMTIRAVVPLAVAAAVALVVLPFLRNTPVTPGIPAAIANAGPGVLLAPDAVRLDAMSKRGELLGPCELKHTDVQASINGSYARVTLTQNFQNPHNRAIDAVYSLPMREGGTVDELKLTIGERIVMGEIVQSDQGLANLDVARAAGNTASLIEQQRPSVFTQSLVNIEAKQQVEVRVSYVEPLVREADGDWSITVPAAVSPRFSSASEGPKIARDQSKNQRALRDGVVLLGPAAFEDVNGKVPSASAIANAMPIAPMEHLSSDSIRSVPADADDVAATFSVRYLDGRTELARIFKGGFGEINGRWFEIPDSNSIATSESVDAKLERPQSRAADQLSIRMYLNTGGPGLISVDSPGFPTTRQDIALRSDGLASSCIVALRPSSNSNDLPNTDFTLRWRLALPGIPLSITTQRADTGDFVAVMLSAPNRVNEDQALPREVQFLVDSSVRTGPDSDIAFAAAQTLVEAIGTKLHPQDTFNVLSVSPSDSSRAAVFSGEPQPVSHELIAAATHWMAENATHDFQPMADVLLRPQVDRVPNGHRHTSIPSDELTSASLDQTPADGREVVLRIRDDELDASGLSTEDVVTDGWIVLAQQTPETEARRVRIERLRLPRNYLRAAAQSLGRDNELSLRIRGRWRTIEGERVFQSIQAELADAPQIPAARALIVLTRSSSELSWLQEMIVTPGAFSRLVVIQVGKDRFDPDPPISIVQVPLPIAPSHLGMSVAEVIRLLGESLLTGLQVTPSPSLTDVDFEPPLSSLHELDARNPIILLGRAENLTPGTLQLDAIQLSGPWQATVNVPVPTDSMNSSIAGDAVTAGPLPSLWARRRVDRLAAEHSSLEAGDPRAAALQSQILSLAQQFGIVTPYTSVLAVDHLRVRIEGQTVLVPVPVEREETADWAPLLTQGVATTPPAPPPSASMMTSKAAAESKAAGEQTIAPPSSRFSPEASSNRQESQATTASRSREKLGAGQPASTASRASFVADSSSRIGRLRQALGGPDESSWRVKKFAMPNNGERVRDQTAAESSASPSSRDFEPNRKRDADEAMRISKPESVSGVLADSSSVPADSGSLDGHATDQNRAAEQFFDAVRNRLQLAEAAGRVPPDRLAAVAGANFIVQQSQAGQAAAAERAQQLFQEQFPSDRLLNELGLALKSQSLESEQFGSTQKNVDTRVRAGSPGSPPKDASAISNQQALNRGLDAALAKQTEQAVQQETLLSRRLDSRLYEQLTPQWTAANREVPSADAARQLYSRASASVASNRAARQTSGGELIVSVLVDSLDDATLNALRNAGLRVERTLPESSVIIGVLTLGSLEPVAMLPCVRRIEPATDEGR